MCYKPHTLLFLFFALGSQLPLFKGTEIRKRLTCACVIIIFSTLHFFVSIHVSSWYYTAFFPGILMIYFTSFCNSGLMAKQWHGFYFLKTLFLSLKVILKIFLAYI